MVARMKAVTKEGMEVEEKGSIWDNVATSELKAFLHHNPIHCFHKPIFWLSLWRALKKITIKNLVPVLTSRAL